MENNKNFELNWASQEMALSYLGWQIERDCDGNWIGYCIVPGFCNLKTTAYGNKLDCFYGILALVGRRSCNQR